MEGAVADRERSRDLILGVLTRRGVASSRELQAATGKSQATVSRLLAPLSDRVLQLGHARATIYALPRPIRGLPAQQPLYWTTASGERRVVGRLSHLAGGQLHIESDALGGSSGAELPWFLTPLRAQGFLGRLHAARLQAAGLSGDPDRWDLESVLYAALQLHDASGALTLGDEVHPPSTHERMQGGAGLADDLDTRAADVARSLPAGSWAGGEQPKFLAVTREGIHVIVKFSPPRGTPFGERWHDLLHAEHVANEVLGEHGVEVARTSLVRSSARTYLVSERFDREGEQGRHHVVSIGDVHRAFVPDVYSHWAATAAALARQRRLDPREAEGIDALLAFGRLIGNSDMHGGNLGLRVDLADVRSGRLRLAPVYDMLPMRWRPDAPSGGAHDYAAFEPDPRAAAGPAAPVARAFWSRLALQAEVSPALRSVAQEMVKRLSR